MIEIKTDFLILTKQHFPIYILRKVDTMLSEPEDTIEKVASEGNIDPTVIIESGYPYRAAIPRLKEYISSSS
ncbi:MAG: hypothetical protein AC479_04320 [miscellaneous Crenarchaeota group-6 archaeon AD8-1]|nr:MAG: hypothetical protein AC479_04320 [miscellaneous Crenarchaeota group-6 archaeon AD8-1]